MKANNGGSAGMALSLTPLRGAPESAATTHTGSVQRLLKGSTKSSFTHYNRNEVPLIYLDINADRRRQRKKERGKKSTSV